MSFKPNVIILFIPILVIASLLLFWAPHESQENLALNAERLHPKDQFNQSTYQIAKRDSLHKAGLKSTFNETSGPQLPKVEDLNAYTLHLDGVPHVVYMDFRYGHPYVSLEEMAPLLDYSISSGENNQEILLLKKVEKESVMALFRNEQRNSLVEIHEKNYHQKELALEGKPYKDTVFGFMIPLENLLHILSYDDVIVDDTVAKATSPKDGLYRSLVESFHDNDALIEKQYFKELDKIQTPQETSFILLGDLSLGTNFGQKNEFDNLWEKEGSSYFLKELQPYFEKSDLVITNLENVFTKRSAYQKGKIYTYKAHRIDYLHVLKEGGITHVNVVNNHMADYLQEGFDDTLNYLKTYDIPYFGTNLSKTDNIEIGNITVDEYQIFEKSGFKIGLIGYLGFNSSYVSDEKIQEDILMLKTVENVDYIIAAMHWGGQNTHEVTKKQKEMGRKLIDFGVDLVYGNHPHVLQEVEIYEGKPIYYSLGNFLFTDYASAKDPDGIMVKVNLTKDFSGEIKETFTHTPILWSGHSSKNTYQPKIMTDNKMIKRTLDKLNVHTKNPFSLHE